MFILKDSAVEALTFRMDDQNANPVTGISPTVTISKNGAGFVTPAGAVSEVGSGLYKVAAHATDSNTLGSIDLYAIDPAATPVALPSVGNGPWQVVAFDPRDAVRAGLSALPNAAANAAGGLPISTAGSLDMDDLAADVDATETRVTLALPAFAPQAAGGLITSTAGSLDMDDLAADVDATETRVTTALPNAAPNAAGGLLITAAGSLDMDDLAADVDATETRVTTALPNAAPNAAGGLLITTAGSLDMDDLAADVDATETRVTTALPNAAPQAAGGLITSTAGSLDIDDLATDVDTIETRVTTALPAVAPNAAGGLLITAAGSLDMDDLAADVDATETRVTTALPNAAPQAAGGLITSIAGSLDLDEMNTDVEDIQTSIGTAGAGLTALGDTRIARLDADISSRSTYAGGAVASVMAPVTLTAAYDAAKTAAQVGSAMALTSGERNSVADAYLDRADAVETGLTPRQFQRLMKAVIAGVAVESPAGTYTIKRADGTTTAVTVVHNTTGDRTSVTIGTL